MDYVKKVGHQEVVMFVYESEEQREGHIKQMKKQGWSVGSEVARLKRKAHLMTASENDYEPYAKFTKYYI